MADDEDDDEDRDSHSDIGEDPVAALAAMRLTLEKLRGLLHAAAAADDAAAEGAPESPPSLAGGPPRPSRESDNDPDD